MKNLALILCCCACLLFNNTNAQSVAINSTGSAANASAILDVTSTSKGALMPRMTESQRANISNPATGLLVYQTDGTSGFYYYTGSAWTALGSGGGGGGATLDLVATRSGTAQTIASRTTDTVIFNNVVTTPSLGSYDNTTGKYTVGVTGNYLITASVTSSISQATNAVIFVNNVIIATGGSTNSVNLKPAGQVGRSSVSMVATLTANDIVTIQSTCTSSSSSLSFTTTGSTRLAITKL